MKNSKIKQTNKQKEKKIVEKLVRLLAGEVEKLTPFGTLTHQVE